MKRLIFLYEEKKILVKAIQPLSDVGLGYIKLGQSSDTLIRWRSTAGKACFISWERQGAAAIRSFLFLMNQQQVFIFMI